MKIELSKMAARKQNEIMVHAFVEAGIMNHEQGEEAINALYEKKEGFNTDLLSVIDTPETVIVIINDDATTEMLEAASPFLPSLLAAAKSLAVIAKSMSKAIGAVQKKWHDKFITQLREQKGYGNENE